MSRAFARRREFGLNEERFSLPPTPCPGRQLYADARDVRVTATRCLGYESRRVLDFGMPASSISPSRQTGRGTGSAPDELRQTRPRHPTFSVEDRAMNRWQLPLPKSQGWSAPRAINRYQRSGIRRTDPRVSGSLRNLKFRQNGAFFISSGGLTAIDVRRAQPANKLSQETGLWCPRPLHEICCESLRGDVTKKTARNSTNRSQPPPEEELLVEISSEELPDLVTPCRVPEIFYMVRRCRLSRPITDPKAPRHTYPPEVSSGDFVAQCGGHLLMTTAATTSWSI